MCGALHRLVGTMVHLDLYLCVVKVMPKIFSVLPCSALYSICNFSFPSSNQHRSMMPVLEIAFSATRFVERIGL